jgi:hypothetical protein
MSTSTAFNELLKNFLSELRASFPEQKGLTMCLAGFDVMATTQPAMPLKLFMEAMHPHAALLNARDSALFEQPLELAGNVDFADIWGQSDVTDSTREAIWSYLQTLYLLGSTIQSLPPEILNSIEKVAGECATQMETTGQMDMNAMAAAMMKSMSSMMMGGGGEKKRALGGRK